MCVNIDPKGITMATGSFICNISDGCWMN